MQKFPEFKNKKVLVMGLGFHGGGVGAVRFFVKQGAKVTVTDLKPKNTFLASMRGLKSYRVKYVLGRHREIDFQNTDFVFKSPDVPQKSPYLEVARRAGIPILDVASIFLTHCSARTIGITGTKGKSTTAALLFEILKKKFKKVWLLGTPGTSILGALPYIKKDDIVILELSSFQLDDLHFTKKSPDIAIITCIFPEHLNRHKTYENYVHAKAAILMYQSKNGALVIPRKSPWMRLIKRKKVLSKILKIGVSEYRSLFSGLKDVMPEDKQNFALAFKVAEMLLVRPVAMRQALKSLRRLAGRREVIRKMRDITFINDTTATNPGAAAASLRFYGKTQKVILIAGGTDKGLEYSNFVKEIARRAKLTVFLPGSATEKMKSRFSKNALKHTVYANFMKEAVFGAYQNARKGDTVLLAPGAASFNLFKHEFDRGEQFVKAVQKLK